MLDRCCRAMKCKGTQRQGGTNESARRVYRDRRARHAAATAPTSVGRLFSLRPPVRARLTRQHRPGSRSPVLLRLSVSIPPPCGQMREGPATCRSIPKTGPERLLHQRVLNRRLPNRRVLNHESGQTCALGAFEILRFSIRESAVLLVPLRRSPAAFRKAGRGILHACW